MNVQNFVFSVEIYMQPLNAEVTCVYNSMDHSLSWEAHSRSASQELFAFYGSQTFITGVTV